MDESTLTLQLTEHAATMLMKSESHAKRAAAIRAQPAAHFNTGANGQAKEAKAQDTLAKRHKAYADHATAKPVSRFAYHEDDHHRQWDHRSLHGKAAAAQRTVVLGDDNQPID